MKNLLKLILVLSISFISLKSYSKDLVVSLHNVISRVDLYSSNTFKKDIIKVLKKNGVSVDTVSEHSYQISYQMRALIKNSADNVNSFEIYYELVNPKSNKTTEIYDHIRYKGSNEPVYSIVERSLLSMETFKDSDEKDDYFMPGAAFDFYQPRKTDIGQFYGPSVEFVFYSRSKRATSKRSGPSRIKSYGKIGILNSTAQDASDLLMVSCGINLSFESKTNRNYLLPYFGLDFGGLYSKSMSTFQFTPHLGVQFLSTKKIIWSGQAGYLYSVRNFDEYSGYSFKTSLNVLLW
ncbi:MAG: hypothetical protein ACI8ZM_001387 [Crocinitomix sp.]|jgi:hypothetical protein